jgi:hypothetical protein
MDVFGHAVESGGGYFHDAAVNAAHELGLFARLARGPASVDELAEAAAVATGRHRLRALLDVLAALGAVVRDAADGDGDGDGRSRFAAAPRVPPPRPLPPGGWGRLAEVIRRDRPLALDDDEVRRYQTHLLVAGAAAARELVAHLPAGSLLDLGGGAGAYTAAYLDAHPAATATLVDDAAVVGLARTALTRFGDRVRLVAGDARTAAAGGGHDVALLSNVLHLCGPEVCAALCHTAASAVAPGGVVVVKDLRVDDGRRGPTSGLLFALNMALYTDGGDAYEVSRLRGWLAAAGLTTVEQHGLAAAPDAVVLMGRRGSRDGDFT